jgi:tetratricopeptide (TPR) repeat protein
MAKGEIERAIADYNLAIATDPSQAMAYLYRGEARRAKGDLEEALAEGVQRFERGIYA